MTMYVLTAVRAEAAVDEGADVVVLGPEDSVAGRVSAPHAAQKGVRTAVVDHRKLHPVQPAQVSPPEESDRRQ